MNTEKISYKKPLLETPFHKRTSEHCYANDWYRWAGYKVAKEYSSTELEYTSMRNTAGVIDITPMHKYEIKGKDAKKFINKLITKDITNIQSNQVAYGIWCNEDGMVIDDGTIFCLNENHYRIFCAERNLNWFCDTATGFNVTIEDISSSIAALAFQGPLSCKILNLSSTGESADNTLDNCFSKNFVANSYWVLLNSELAKIISAYFLVSGP